MEFKKPQPLKRLSDGGGFNSPSNRKKTKLLSTSIATPETPETHKIEADPFDDNFSQFFQTQFVKQIPGLEASFMQNAPNSNKQTTTSDYDFTQCDGLSQFILDDSQLDGSITLGQRCLADDLFIRDADNETEAGAKEASKQSDENTDFEFTLNQVIIDDEQNDNPQPLAEHEDIHNEHEADAIAEAELTVQSSQLFLKELSDLQMNISSIVNETLNANKFCTQDFLDPSNDTFDVFKSNTTNSQYLHLKRPNEPKHEATIMQNEFKTPQNLQRTDLNTEMIEDQLLAEMIMTTQALANNTELLEDQLLAAYNEDDDLNVSERLNECIDPDSSALDLSSEEDDKENIQNVDLPPKEVNTSVRKEEQTTSNVRHTPLRTIQQNDKPHHSPVTASKFYSMGPFFGLPLQVKKLIKTFKNIDDLYGTIRV